MLLVIPAIAIEYSGGAWRKPFVRPVWEFALIAQAVVAAGVLGLTAVQEFVECGGGTPVPFDPPRRLVTTGVYAYVRNPMQLTGVMVLLLLGVAVQNLWVSVSAVMAHLYSIGLAGWDEEEDLRRRFGDDWLRYRMAVPRWIPRWRPWRSSDRQPARLFVAQSCVMCSQVGRWFSRRMPQGLEIVAAETHPSGMLTRITYEPGVGGRAAGGVESIARALEHTHFGWAFAGFVMRLPVVCAFIQLLIDACGGEPRRRVAVADRSAYS